jgi:hypothetical protein
MITIANTADITAALEKATALENAEATCRVIEHEAPGCQEWAGKCEIEGFPAVVYYIFEDEECQAEDAEDYPWDSNHVSKIVIAEYDEDGDLEIL